MSIWLDVPGYEGLYQVSDAGEVRSIDRQVTGKNGVTQHLNGQLLKQHLKGKGYPCVSLSKSGTVRQRYVHDLVLLAFEGIKPRGLEVRHQDGNPLNTQRTNLIYGTRSENFRDMREHGTHHYGSRTHCKHNHEYTEKNTRIIWHNNGNGPTPSRVCRECERIAGVKKRAKKKEALLCSSSD